jgi:peptidoglycan/LPS O-acetylase OafA/YrhL
MVIFHHGPKGGFPVSLLHDTGGFGLSMFFLLSAYLITELLLREREKTGTVDWRRFFARRALRIWPLYYAAIAAAGLVSLAGAHWISHTGLLVMPVFIANWFVVSAPLGTLVPHLWSISVEEQFYVIWPPIVKWGRRRSVIAASLLLAGLAAFWVVHFHAKGWRLWYAAPVDFVFFAAGAMLALATRKGLQLHLRPVARAGLVCAGALAWIGAARVGRIGTDDLQNVHPEIGYPLVLAGCVAFFLALFDLQHLPQPLLYLGKISYGLYVFHLGALAFAERILVPTLRPVTVYALAVDSAGLLITIGLAHLSYRYFEKTFLLWKERFTVIRSRAI